MDFAKNGNLYETTFSASTPFNIHIERDGGRVLSVSRRTAGEGWETIEIIRQGRVIDADVYNDIEREYRIQSDVEPTMCEITFGTAVGPDVPTETLIEFKVDSYLLGMLTLKAQEGMTWYEWCASEYNAYGFSCDAPEWNVNTYYKDDVWSGTCEVISDVLGKDIITEKTYATFDDSWGVGGGGAGE